MGPLVVLTLIRRKSAHSLSSYGSKLFLKSESQKSIAPHWSVDFRSIFIGLAGRGSAGRIGVDPAQIGPLVLELWVETVFEI